MQINIKSCKPEEAKGLTVIIDVMHASSTIVQLLESGIEKLIPISKNTPTKQFKEQGFLIFGERFSTAFRKSEYLNSPFVAESMDLKRKKIVIKTDNGTRAIFEAKNASEILIGCFLNSKALLNYIKHKKPNTVDLIPIGRKGKPAIEDELFAEYFKKLLENKRPNFEYYKKRIEKESWINILRLIFLSEHTKYCLRFNSSNIVPVYKNGELVSIKL